MKITTANGTEGVLIYNHGAGTYSFRVYNADHTFKDYDILHSDLVVKITDEDAFFYEQTDGKFRLDHNPDTLGLSDERTN
jgi:hypothetical protein